MVSADQLPKAFISKRRRHQYGDADDRDDKNPLIIRPLVELEVPDFVARADEILEKEIAARLAAEAKKIADEEERRRILNRTPVNFLGPRQIAK